MRRAGLLVWQAHQAAASLLRPGVTTGELNQAVADTFSAADAIPLFLNYPGESTPFPAETCISVNEEVVHGIPGERALVEGDIVSLDTGCKIDGWCGDAAITHAIGQIDDQTQRLLNVTSGVLDLAIDLMGKKRMWSDVAREMQQYVEAAGFSVVKDMVGHGIGREMHEKPQVPNYYSKEFAVHEDFDIRPGVVLAIEPMVNVGTSELALLDDNWTLISADEQPSAHFEHTVALTKNGPLKLTGPPTESEMDLVPQQFRDPSCWAVW